jgi:hypothetical protein
MGHMSIWGTTYILRFVLEISFEYDTFDKLVLDKTTKKLILSLVTSNHDEMNLISGKGGGCTFLLHGPWRFVIFKLLSCLK